MHINTQKAIMWLSIAVAIETAIGAGTVSLTNAIPKVWIPTVTAWCGILAFIGSTIVAALTGNAIYGSGSAPKPIALLIGGVLLALLMPADAFAQPRLQAAAQRNDANKTTVSPMVAAPAAAQPARCLLVWDPLKLCGALTGDIQTDTTRVADRLRQAVAADLSYAMAKAKAANTNASKVRLQCLTAINEARVQLAGTDLKDDSGAPITRPDPSIASNLEDAAELVDLLSPQGALLTSCAGAAAMAKLNALQMVNAFVTGAAALATGAAAGL